MHMLRMRRRIHLFEPGVSYTARADQIVHGEVKKCSSFICESLGRLSRDVIEPATHVNRK